MRNINTAPILTSKNYGINDITTTDNDIAIINTPFDNYQISNTKGLKIKKTAFASLTYPISQKLYNLVNNITHTLDITDKITSTIYIRATFDAQNNYLKDILNINVQKGVRANVCIIYQGKTHCMHYGIIQSHLEQNSSLDITILSDINGNNYLNIQDEKDKNAKINYHIIDFGTQSTVQNLFSTTLSPNTHTTLDTMYAISGQGVIDLNYLARLNHKNSNATFRTIGILTQDAIKHYKGTIDFVKGASGSHGDEDEYCILASPTAKSSALPMLLCSEDDVTGSHSSSAGSVDNAALFYLMSRGLKLDEAKKLLIKARFNQTINNIPDEDIRQLINNELDRRITDEN